MCFLCSDILKLNIDIIPRIESDRALLLTWHLLSKKKICAKININLLYNKNSVKYFKSPLH